MDSLSPLVVPLCDAEGLEVIVGGKAAKLSRLAAAGFRVPRGFCITTTAYEEFLQESRIDDAIRMELGRKPIDDMRWEEIWDAALRIRSSFLAQPLSERLRNALRAAWSNLDPSKPLAVRSSALGEDSETQSFAGLHESFTEVTSQEQLWDAVRLVWASLWSDAALLYRRELGLDPAASRMAVLVQEMVHTSRSGVAFGRDPRDLTRLCAVIEAVPGPCRLLVDGEVEPDRWEVHPETRQVLSWRSGHRDTQGGADAGMPLLDAADVDSVLGALLSVEELFRWPPDVEWTGRSSTLTILQARPITVPMAGADETRRWYLSLRPGDVRLRELSRKVSQELIPKLAAEGDRLAGERLEHFGDARLAEAIEERRDALRRWKKVYWDEFIPFAHGVRRLGTYYNDAVHPDDPYEFIGLLRNQPLIAAQRNSEIRRLAAQLATNEPLRGALSRALDAAPGTLDWEAARRDLERIPGGTAFVDGFIDLCERYLDIAYDRGRLRQDPEPLLRNILELSRRAVDPAPADAPAPEATVLERRLLDAVGPDRRAEARELVEIGRISWKLRDDDNLLLARIESQLLRALDVGADRLRAAGRIRGGSQVDERAAAELVRTLRDPKASPAMIPPKAQPAPASGPLSPGETPRQLIGQPASPGLAIGPVRCIRERQDLGRFRRGEVLVCDAIQPTMTHLVPLAAAIVERRGGMLNHGAIIARELGIPCVNGVRRAADLLDTGIRVTVDGNLGIVTVGDAEFDLEFGRTSAPPQPE